MYSLLLSPVMNTPGSQLESLGEAIFQTQITCPPVVEVNYSKFFTMAFPLKIVMCSLKSVKRLPGVY